MFGSYLFPLTSQDAAEYNKHFRECEPKFLWSPLLCTPKPRFKFAPRSRQDQQVPVDAEFLHKFSPFEIGISMRDDAARERVAGHRVRALPSKQEPEPVEQLVFGHVFERLFELVPT